MLTSMLMSGLSAQDTVPADASEVPGAVGAVSGHVPAQFVQAQTAPAEPENANGAASASDKNRWWSPGQAGALPAEPQYANPTGAFGLYNAGGRVETEGHPFFEAIGENGRACVTCHQPSDAMSISVDTIRERWEETDGKDPLFALVDGANCPNKPEGDKASHSLLLDRGLFRVFLPWPPRAADGSKIDPDFTLEVVRDPTGCNTDPVYGLNSPNPMVSIYRRPRPVMNMKYVVGPQRAQRANPSVTFLIKNGMPAAVDPETGQAVSMQIMSDAREPTLKTQAVSAAVTHLQAKSQLTEAQLKQIVDFEMQLYGAQVASQNAGSLTEADGPPALGPRNMERGEPLLGDFLERPVFMDFVLWNKPVSTESSPQQAFRASVARGADVFFLKPFWIKDAMHINTVGLGNPTKRTCATCHNMMMTGMDAVAGWYDLGTTNLPWAREPLVSPFTDQVPELPLFKVTCKPGLPEHPFYGRVIYTQDPGRALISGSCRDVGAVVSQQFRGLAARAPYFSNGSASNLRELVDFYDRRFLIRYSEQEKQDLVNFLSVL